MKQIKKDRILIVDDDESNIIALLHMLNHNFTIFVVKDGQDAIEIAEEELPDVILLDIVMPKMDGYAVISALKNSEKTRDIPVIFITGLSNPGDEEKGLDMGAADYISKPFSPAIVKLRIMNQIKILDLIRSLEMLSMVDHLTAIPNRRGFDNRLDMEWVRAIRENTSLSILIMDVDNFKLYNDTYGHQQGDVALQIVAKTVEQSLNRPGDFAARWGGEEFVVLLPNTDLGGALHIAETIRVNVSNVVIPCTDGAGTKVTASFGVKTLAPGQKKARDSLLADADRALYVAKASGRNRVCNLDED